MRERVARAVRERGLDVEVEALAGAARTVEDAARAVGCGPGQIAKSIVFVADGEPVVCVASGAGRVDARRVCEALDCAEARPATPEEVRAATGFGVGGVPPVAHGLPVIFDEALLEHDLVYAAGGDGNTLFAVAPARLVECTQARVARVADGSAPA